MPAAETEAELNIKELKTCYPLVTRERECSELDAFLKKSLEEVPRGQGGCLYLSGGPGTGKTCAARSAAKAYLQQRPETRIVEINCMALQQCSLPGLLVRLVEACGSRKSQINTRSPLSSLLSAAATGLRDLGKNVIFIVDEVDQLVRRPQCQRSTASLGEGALEALFSLPRKPGAPVLAMVMIANAVDLLARSVRPSAQSMCTALLFEPYSAEQLRTIVKDLFAAAGSAGEAAAKALGRVAMELRIRQVAKTSGDCRHIVRLCEDGFTEAMPSEEDAEADKSSSSQDAVPAAPTKTAPSMRVRSYDPLQEVKELPVVQQILLCTLSIGSSETTRFSEVFQRYKALLTRMRQSLDGVSKPQVQNALSAFDQRGLLRLKSLKGGTSSGGKGRGLAAKGSVPAELVVDLNVSRKALREALSNANPMLQQCLEA